MADVTITNLPNATTPLSGTERVPMDQSGVTRDASTQAIADLAGTAITAAVAAHAAAANPHPTYLTQAEGDALYAPIGGGGGGTVTSVTGTAPIAVANGTTTPAISISAASGSAAGSMSSADFTKLAGVAAGATANASNAELRDRATHTGTQAWSTITSTPTTLAGYGIADAQPLDSDLTAIAALATTSYGRSFLALADAAAARTAVGLGVAVVSDVTGITGADRITNMVSLTQAEYDAITPNASTFYVII